MIRHVSRQIARSQIGLASLFVQVARCLRRAQDAAPYSSSVAHSLGVPSESSSPTQLSDANTLQLPSRASSPPSYGIARSVGPHPESTAMRAAMRRLAGPVAILTVKSQDSSESVYGMIVSSFTVVSLDPVPMVSFNVKRPSHTLETLYKAASGGGGASRAADTYPLPFYLHLPSQSPTAAKIARVFSEGSAATKLARAAVVAPDVARLRESGEGCFPVSPDMPVVLSCRVRPEKCVTVGDHDIVVARIRRVEYLSSKQAQAEGGQHMAAAASGGLSEMAPFQGLLYGNGSFREWDAHSTVNDGTITDTTGALSARVTRSTSLDHAEFLSAVEADISWGDSVQAGGHSRAAALPFETLPADVWDSEGPAGETGWVGKTDKKRTFLDSSNPTLAGGDREGSREPIPFDELVDEPPFMPLSDWEAWTDHSRRERRPPQQQPPPPSPQPQSDAAVEKEEHTPFRPIFTDHESTGPIRVLAIVNPGRDWAEEERLLFTELPASAPPFSLFSHNFAFGWNEAEAGAPLPPRRAPSPWLAHEHLPSHTLAVEQHQYRHDRLEDLTDWTRWRGRGRGRYQMWAVATEADSVEAVRGVLRQARDRQRLQRPARQAGGSWSRAGQYLWHGGEEDGEGSEPIWEEIGEEEIRAAVPQMMMGYSNTRDRLRVGERSTVRQIDAARMKARALAREQRAGHQAEAEGRRRRREDDLRRYPFDNSGR